MTGSNTPGGRIGDCVVKHYMASFGEPVASQGTELVSDFRRICT